MGHDIVRGKTARDWARGDAPPKGSWEYAGVGEMWNAGKDVTMNMETAIKHLQGRYASLSKQGSQLITLAQAGKLPGDIWQAYDAARKDYLLFGQDLFRKLDQKGIKIRQIVYRKGAPVPDPSSPYGGVKTLELVTPLMPPTVMKPTSPPMVSGESDEMGVLPLVIPGALVMGKWLIIGVASIMALRSLAVVLHGPNVEYDKKVSAFLKLRAAGLTPQEAEASLEKQEKAGKEKGLKWWHMLLGGAGAGGILWWFGRRK